MLLKLVFLSGLGLQWRNAHTFVLIVNRTHPDPVQWCARLTQRAGRRSQRQRMCWRSCRWVAPLSVRDSPAAAAVVVVAAVAPARRLRCSPPASPLTVRWPTSHWALAGKLYSYSSVRLQREAKHGLLLQSESQVSRVRERSP